MNVLLALAESHPLPAYTVMGLLYLAAGVALTLFYRFYGLPDVAHEHTEGCYAQGPYNRLTAKLQRGELACNKYLLKLGGKPFQLWVWAVWILLWPASIVGILAFIGLAASAWLLYELAHGLDRGWRRIKPMLNREF